MAERTEVNITGGYTPFMLRRNPHLDIFGQSLNKLDAAFREADDRKLAVAEAFAQARELLPDNEETNQYITDNQNKVTDAIDEALRRDDPYNAIRVGKNLASAFVSSPEFDARKKEHKSRKEWIEQLDRSNVDNYIKEYYKDTYQDKNNFTRDKDGNITGTAGWEAPLPEQGQSANSIIQAAVKATADQRTDTGSSWTVEDGTGGSRASSREWLTADRISSTAKSLVNNDPRVKQAFVDQFNAGIHQITKLTNLLAEVTDPIRRAEIENQIAGYKNAYYKNDAPMESAQAYIDNLFSADNNEIKNAAYDYNHSRLGSDKYANGRGPNSSDGYNLGNGAGDLENTNGAPVESTTTGGSTLSSKGNRKGLR